MFDYMYFKFYKKSRYVWTNTYDLDLKHLNLNWKGITPGISHFSSSEDIKTKSCIIADRSLPDNNNASDATKTQIHFPWL